MTAANRKQIPSSVEQISKTMRQIGSMPQIIVSTIGSVKHLLASAPIQESNSSISNFISNMESLVKMEQAAQNENLIKFNNMKGVSLLKVCPETYKMVNLWELDTMKVQVGCILVVGKNDEEHKNFGRITKVDRNKIYVNFKRPFKGDEEISRASYYES